MEEWRILAWPAIVARIKLHPFTFSIYVFMYSCTHVLMYRTDHVLIKYSHLSEHELKVP